MSYGGSCYRRVPSGRHLRQVGFSMVSNRPICRSSNPRKLQLVINLSTVRALGLTIPAALLATADEVIQ